jgi:hypothetical protein
MKYDVRSDSNDVSSFEFRNDLKSGVRLSLGVLMANAGFFAGLGAGLSMVLVGLVAIFLFAIIGALMGAVGGFIVQITPWLGDTVKAGFSSIFEVESPDLVAIGAMLGFIAGFFRQWGHEHG